MFAELVLFGTFWFWAFLAGVIILEFIFMEYESPRGATWTFILALWGLTCFTDLNLFSTMYDNPFWTVAAFCSYGLVGAIYSISWFRLYISNDKEKYRDMKESWLGIEGINGTAVPSSRLSDWIRYATRNGWRLTKISTSQGEVQIPERFLMRRHKARITMRIAFWPLSMIWTLLNDPIKKMAKWIYRKLQGVYQRITISATREIVDELQSPSAPSAPVGSTTTSSGRIPVDDEDD